MNVQSRERQKRLRHSPERIKVLPWGCLGVGTTRTYSSPQTEHFVTGRTAATPHLACGMVADNGPGAKVEKPPRRIAQHQSLTQAAQAAHSTGCDLQS